MKLRVITLFMGLGLTLIGCGASHNNGNINGNWTAANPPPK